MRAASAVRAGVAGVRAPCPTSARSACTCTARWRPRGRGARCSHRAARCSVERDRPRPPAEIERRRACPRCMRGLIGLAMQRRLNLLGRHASPRGDPGADLVFEPACWTICPATRTACGSSARGCERRRAFSTNGSTTPGAAARGEALPAVGRATRGGAARSADHHGLGQSLRPGRERGERGGRPGRDRTDQRRGGHRTGRAALLQPLLPRRG